MANKYTKNDALFIDIDHDPMFKQGGIVTTAKIQQQSGVTPYKLVDAVDIDWNGATLSNVKNYVQLTEEPAEADKVNYYVLVDGKYVKYDPTQHSEINVFYEEVPEVLNDTSDLIEVLDSQFAKISAATGDLGDWIAQINANTTAITAINNAGYVTAEDAADIASDSLTYIAGGDNISISTDNGYTYVNAYGLVTVTDLTNASYVTATDLVNASYVTYAYVASQNFATQAYAYDAAYNAVAAVIAGADASFDTLKEIADWIQNDTTGAAYLANEVARHTTEIGAPADGETAATGLYGLVDTAQTTASDAATAAATADDKADAAQTKANSAYTLAENAYSKAETAVTNAATAQERADNAYTLGESAYARANTAYTLADEAYTSATSALSNAAGALERANAAYSYAETANQAIDVLNDADSVEGSIGYRIKAILAEANKKAEALKNLQTATTETVGDTTVNYSYVSSEMTYSTDEVTKQTTYSVDISVQYGDSTHDGIALYSTVEEMVAESQALSYAYTYSALDWQIL